MSLVRCATDCVLLACPLAALLNRELAPQRRLITSGFVFRLGRHVGCTRLSNGVAEDLRFQSLHQQTVQVSRHEWDLIRQVVEREIRHRPIRDAHGVRLSGMGVNRRTFEVLGSMK